MSLQRAVSIVVPTLNEADNIKLLVERIDASFSDSTITYEIVFIDDHSLDHTQLNIKRLAQEYPISLHEKVGSRGKAHSLLQGFTVAQYDVICMIDADLQYPPEAIVPMYELIDEHNVDVVITKREDNETSFIRQVSSKVFSFLFTRMLFGFNYDSQSGLKVFKKSVVKNISLNPTPWSFDLEFIVRSLERDYKILSYDIPFTERHSGAAKVKLLEVTYELAKASLTLRANSSTKQVKKAYRRNVEFAKRVENHFSAAIIVISLITGITFVHQGNVAAQSVEASYGSVQSVQATNNIKGSHE